MGSRQASVSQSLYEPPKKGVFRLLRENPYVLGLACVCFCHPPYVKAHGRSDLLTLLLTHSLLPLEASSLAMTKESSPAS